MLPLTTGSTTRWLPPNSLAYKVNFDGAIFKELGAASLGVVIRDSEGMVIRALAKRIPLPCSIAMAEALAYRRAVLFAKKMSIFKSTVKGRGVARNEYLGGPGCNRNILNIILKSIGYKIINFHISSYT